MVECGQMDKQSEIESQLKDLRGAVAELGELQSNLISRLVPVTLDQPSPGEVGNEKVESPMCHVAAELMGMRRCVTELASNIRRQIGGLEI